MKSPPPPVRTPTIGLLRTEEGAQALLTDKYREAKACQKRKAKRADRKGTGRDHDGTKNKCSYSSSEMSPGSSDFTDSSSEDGGRVARKSSSSSPTPDYQRVFESTQHSAWGACLRVDKGRAPIRKLQPGGSRELRAPAENPLPCLRPLPLVLARGRAQLPRAVR